jgi:hypothetical protein
VGANSSLAGAKAQIVAELRAAQASFGEADVFEYSPDPSEYMNGKAVAVFTAGYTPTTWQIAVQILVSITVNVKDAQDAIDEWMPAIDAALSKSYGPQAWTVDLGATPDAPYYSATNVLDVGREDF